jgi:hypothetical protein
MRIRKEIRTFVWIVSACVGAAVLFVIGFFLYGAMRDLHRGYPKDILVQRVGSPDSRSFAELHKIEYDSRGVRDSVFITLGPDNQNPWEKERVYSQVYECDSTKSLALVWKDSQHLSIDIGRCEFRSQEANQPPDLRRTEWKSVAIEAQSDNH